MKNIKVRYLWLMVLVLLLIAVGLILWIVNAPNGMTQVLTVILVIVFIIITFLVQYATFRTYNAKNKKKIKYNTKTYEAFNDLNTLLENNKFKKKNRHYGDSYIKIDGSVAYKVVIIKDINAYYNHEEDQNYEADRRLDSCKIMIGMEIFNEVSEDALGKIPDYSFEVDKIYYTALVAKDDNKYICLNYIMPNDNHKKYVDNLISMLELKEIEE